MGIEDVPWKTILNIAIDVGGPILAQVVDSYAPGAGTVLRVGLPVVKKLVVEPYVPDGINEPGRQAAVNQLVLAGWKESDAEQHIMPPVRTTKIDTVDAAYITYGVLMAAGWSPDEAYAILQGRYFFKDWQTTSPMAPDVMAYYHHDKIRDIAAYGYAEKPADTAFVETADARMFAAIGTLTERPGEV